MLNNASDFSNLYERDLSDLDTKENSLAQNFIGAHAPLFLFGLKKQETELCFDAIEICGAGQTIQTVEIYICDFGNFSNVGHFAEQGVRAGGG